MLACFGLTVKPNGDNCCALLSLAGQRKNPWAMSGSVHLYGSEGWGFESLRARHISAGQSLLLRCAEMSALAAEAPT